MKLLRTSLGIIFVLIGTVGFILPGSFVFLIAGLMMLSVDFPLARHWLTRAQRSASRSAGKLDRFLLKRKFR